MASSSGASPDDDMRKVLLDLREARLLPPEVFDHLVETAGHEYWEYEPAVDAAWEVVKSDAWERLRRAGMRGRESDLSLPYLRDALIFEISREPMQWPDVQRDAHFRGPVPGLRQYRDARDALEPMPYVQHEYTVGFGIDSFALGVAVVAQPALFEVADIIWTNTASNGAPATSILVAVVVLYHVDPPNADGEPYIRFTVGEYSFAYEKMLRGMQSAFRSIAAHESRNLRALTAEAHSVEKIQRRLERLALYEQHDWSMLRIKTSVAAMKTLMLIVATDALDVTVDRAGVADLLLLALGIPEVHLSDLFHTFYYSDLPAEASGFRQISIDDQIRRRAEWI